MSVHLYWILCHHLDKLLLKMFDLSKELNTSYPGFICFPDLLKSREKGLYKIKQGKM